jgi:hypothetical protein
MKSAEPTVFAGKSHAQAWVTAPTLRQRWRGAAKALTWFRESATPDGHLDDFSNAYPRPRGHPHLPGENPQIPIFRHFSVIRRGIKT